MFSSLLFISCQSLSYHPFTLRLGFFPPVLLTVLTTTCHLEGCASLVWAFIHQCRYVWMHSCTNILTHSCVCILTRKRMLCVEWCYQADLETDWLSPLWASQGWTTDPAEKPRLPLHLGAGQPVCPPTTGLTSLSNQHGQATCLQTHTNTHTHTPPASISGILR